MPNHSGAAFRIRSDITISFFAALKLRTRWLRWYPPWSDADTATALFWVMN